MNISTLVMLSGGYTKYNFTLLYFWKLAELVYETHISQVKEEVSQLKSRLVELISLVQDVVSILWYAVYFRLISLKYNFFIRSKMLKLFGMPRMRRFEKFEMLWNWWWVAWTHNWKWSCLHWCDKRLLSLRRLSSWKICSKKLKFSLTLVLGLFFKQI